MIIKEGGDTQMMREDCEKNVEETIKRSCHFVATLMELPEMFSSINTSKTL
jgi:hypothetical protein